ncbi:hypothetical protein CO611_07850 [Lysobacteraceae bacterium NML03-0222]|nr:hypothetical protein CO611_07850 [Xanthomonadaceae bacterium NML03-0222]
MISMKPLATALLLGGITLSFTACKKVGEAVQAAKTATEANSAASAENGTEKFNAYISCYNDADASAHRSMREYASWVQDMDAGPTGKESNIDNPGTISENAMEGCNKITALADAKPAIAGLDEAAKAYAASLSVWAARLQEADKYYSNEDYKDDNMAKGKAMHTDFVAAYRAFDEASDRFSDALEEVGHKRRLEELATLEKSEGKKFRYWHLSASMNAESLINHITEDEFDVEKAQALIQAYEESSEALKNYAKSAEQQEVPSGFGLFVTRQESFLQAAKKRMRRVRDKQPYSSGDISYFKAGHGRMVEGSTESVVHAYNQLVDASNFLH